MIGSNPAELESVDGIGPKRRARIAQAWHEGVQIREIMLFLHSHGVSTGRAVRIYKTYGEQAIEKVRENPYTLAKDILGIGFATADQIAQRVGIPKDSQNRARAGIDHVLLGATSEGHCALPLEKLTLAAVKLLEAPEATIDQALSQMLTGGSLLLEEIDGEPLIFLPHLRKAEDGIATKINAVSHSLCGLSANRLREGHRLVRAADRKDACPESARGIENSPGQSCRHHYGWPGCGQDNLGELDSDDPASQESEVSAVRSNWTGRETFPTETTGLEAKTIHRLLEVDPATGKFSRNEDKPLDCDLLIVDETSMVDVLLMYALLGLFRRLPD